MWISLNILIDIQRLRAIAPIPFIPRSTSTQNSARLNIKEIKMSTTEPTPPPEVTVTGRMLNLEAQLQSHT